MEMRRLTGTTGARFDGVDLKAVPDMDLAEIRKALVSFGVVVIRDQFLEPKAHVELARRLGRIVHTDGAVHHGRRGNDVLQDHPEVFRVANQGKGPDSTEQWHSDNCHVERPTAISILAAQVLPELGGDTLFANQYAAYDTLSDRFKRMLRGLRLKHSGASQLGYRERNQAEAPFSFHPVVRTHGETGRRALFIGGRQGPGRPHFEGMTPAESLPLQQYLYEQATQPDRCYRHTWMPGDVLMWDNRCTLHFAVHDYGSAVRDMNRVTVEGEVPFEAPYED